MEKYVPDIYQKSIYTIDYDKLKARGIKCLLYDLDNTLVPFDVKEADQKIKNLFDELKEKGFKVIIFSNSPKTRLKPFKEYLDVDCSASSRKPFKASFLKILNEYKFGTTSFSYFRNPALCAVTISLLCVSLYMSRKKRDAIPAEKTENEIVGASVESE